MADTAPDTASAVDAVRVKLQALGTGDAKAPAAVKGDVMRSADQVRPAQHSSGMVNETAHPAAAGPKPPPRTATLSELTLPQGAKDASESPASRPDEAEVEALRALEALRAENAKLRTQVKRLDNKVKKQEVSAQCAWVPREAGQ